MAAEATPANKYEQYVTDNPEKPGQNFLSFSSFDVALNVIAVLTAMIVWVILGSFLAAILVGVLWYCLMHRWEYGRTYYVIREWFISRHIQLALRNTIWTSEKRRLRFQNRPPPIAFRTGEIEGGIGFMDLNGVTDVIVLTGTGSALISGSIEEQYETQNRLADGIKRIASSVENTSIGVSFVHLRRLPDIPALHDILNTILDPDVAVPIGLDPKVELTPEQKCDLELHKLLFGEGDEEQRRDSVIGMQNAYASKTTMAMVITIQRDKKFIPAVKGKEELSAEELNRLTITVVAEDAQDVLNSVGVTDVEVLNLEGLNAFVRGAWDVLTLDEYYAQLALMTEEEKREAAYSLNHWPRKHIKAYHRRCDIDGSHHAVIRIKKLPHKTLPGFFRQLFAIHSRFLAVTMLSEAVNSDTELKTLGRLIPMKDALDEKYVARKSPHAREKDEAREKREEDLHRAHFSQAFNILLAVSDTDPNRLDERTKQVIRTIRSMTGMKASRVTGRARIVKFFFSAATGVPWQ